MLDRGFHDNMVGYVNWIKGKVNVFSFWGITISINVYILSKTKYAKRQCEEIHFKDYIKDFIDTPTKYSFHVSTLISTFI